MVKLFPDIKEETNRRIELITPKIVDIRRGLHRHPERSKREKKASDLVANYLTALGCEVILETNVYSATDAAEQSKSLLADVPRVFTMVAKKRGERRATLASLLAEEG